MLKIYKASAGSGKTYRLAYEYIKLILGVRVNPDAQWQLNPLLLQGRPSLAHRKVLAITFTNKATEEMKGRIIKNLSILGNAETPDDHKYIPELMDEFGCSFEHLKTAACNAKVSLLLDFGFFNVSTIDAFFQTILRTFARELDIQGDYNIQINTGDAVSDALNLMLDHLNAIKDNSKDPLERRVKKWLDDYVTERTESNDKDVKFSPFQRGSKLFRTLVKSVNVIFTEQFKSLQTDLRTYLDDPENLARLSKALEKQKAATVGDMASAETALRAAIDASGNTPKLKANFSAALEKFGQGLITRIDKNPVSLKSIYDGDYDLKKYLNKGFTPSDTVVAALGKFRSSMISLLGTMRTAELIGSQIPQLEFLCLMMKYLDRVREQSNMLILDDTSNHISRIIDNSYVPFIFEHLGNDYRHFLIDEFQDTSRLQWKNILPLILNSHSERDDSLIIGDTKQAIYRFRNSDASILGNDLENKVFTDPDEREVHGDTPAENTNHRTAHGIIRFNNRFLPLFAQAALDTAEPAGFCGDEVVQECFADNAWLPSVVAFVPYIKPEKGSDEPVAYDISLPILERPVATTEDDRVRAIVDQIKAQHDQRGYAWRDITVLVRNNYTAEPIIKALLEKDIPVQSTESLYLKNASSVRMLLSVLNMLTRAGAPDAPIRARKPDEPHKTRREAYMEQALFESRYNYFLNAGATSPQDAINKALDPEITDVDTNLDSAIQGIIDLHPSTLLATIEAIIARGLVPHDIVLAEKDYIAAFCDAALRFSETNTNDSGAFLDWWRIHGNRITIAAPSDTDAVRIMTIHKAKGLEWKCVHIADFDWPLIDNREKAWYDVRPGNENGIDLGLTSVDENLIPPMVLVQLTDNAAGYPGSPFAHILEQQKKLMRTDALNIAYVALTRPISELFVYYNPQAEGTVGEAAAKAFAQMAGAPTTGNPLMMDIPCDCYNAETGALYFEVAPTAKKSKNHEPRLPDEVNDDMPVIDYLEDYYSSVRPDMTSFITVASLERDDNDDEADDEAVPPLPGDDKISARMKLLAESTRRGVQLHDILQHIKVAGDIDSALQTFTDSEQPDATTLEAYRHTIQNAITPQIARRWFNPADTIETEISYFVPCDNKLDAFKDGHIRRIDRLVERSDGTVDVVDYKFTTEQSKEHIDQVRHYVKAIRAIMPDRQVRGYLWYIDRNELVAVD